MLEVEIIDGVPEIHPQKLKDLTGVRLIDVRRPDEFNGELGHIAGAELVTLGPDLQAVLEKGPDSRCVVFICRSGGRSARATLVSLSMGFKDVANLTGGMMLWNSLGLPVERSEAR